MIPDHLTIPAASGDCYSYQNFFIPSSFISINTLPAMKNSLIQQRDAARSAKRLMASRLRPVENEELFDHLFIKVKPGKKVIHKFQFNTRAHQ